MSSTELLTGVQLQGWGGQRSPLDPPGSVYSEGSHPLGDEMRPDAVVAASHMLGPPETQKRKPRGLIPSSPRFSKSRCASTAVGLSRGELHPPRGAQLGGRGRAGKRTGLSSRAPASLSGHASLLACRMRRVLRVRMRRGSASPWLPLLDMIEPERKTTSLAFYHLQYIYTIRWWTDASLAGLYRV